VDLDIDVAVLTLLGYRDARPDGCDIGVKGESDLGPIVALRECNTACWAPAASVCDILDIDLGRVDRGWLRHGGGGGYCCAETEDDSGD